MQHKEFSTLMRLSWTIQRNKKTSRSKSLLSAWVIYQQADIMVYYLVQKHTPPNRATKPASNNLQLNF